MQHSKITFFLYCEWNHIPPSYRLYFDDELMTERTYIWKNEDNVLQEQVHVEADTTIPHTIKIEQLEPKTGKFEVKQLETVTGEDTLTDIDIKVTIV